MVESREEVIECIMNCHGGQTITKGKRTKRQRSMSPLGLTMACSSSEDRSSSVSQSGRLVACDNVSSSSGTAQDLSVDQGRPEGIGLDEEDMANCLILLARGERVKPAPSLAEPGHASANGTDTGNKAGGGLDSYQCKTCSRCFPSFQALGGHRASHKKPRLIMNGYANEKKILYGTTRPPVVGGGHADDQSLFTALSLQIPAGPVVMPAAQSASKSKVHECLICGAEFTSGQALGGHMRRHRTVVPAPPTAIAMGSSSSSNIIFEAQDHQVSKNSSRNNLHLDLNLPAPPEDRGSKYSSNSLTTPKAKEQVLVFSASPLVDCYY